MSEEIERQETPAAPAATTHSNGAGKPERLVPSFRLEQESARAREAVAVRDDAVKQLATMQQEFEKLQSAFNETRSNHAIDLQLIERGFTAKSVQRFFRNEYRESVSELPSDKRPEFSEWLDANREDPLYRVHFASATTPETAPKSEEEKREPALGIADEEGSLARALAAVLNGNPDRFTGQPARGNETEWTAENIRKHRAKNGGTLGDAKDAILAQWRAKGVIK